METIRPSADLRNHDAEISRLCREGRQPVHITVNGRNDTVLLSAADYAQMKGELELLRTDKFNDQLHEIILYIAQDTGSVDRAVQYLDEMEAFVHQTKAIASQARDFFYESFSLGSACRMASAMSSCPFSLGCMPSRQRWAWISPEARKTSRRSNSRHRARRATCWMAAA